MSRVTTARICRRAAERTRGLRSSGVLRLPSTVRGRDRRKRPGRLCPPVATPPPDLPKTDSSALRLPYPRAFRALRTDCAHPLGRSNRLPGSIRSSPRGALRPKRLPHPKDRRPWFRRRGAGAHNPRDSSMTPRTGPTGFPSRGHPSSLLPAARRRRGADPTDRGSASGRSAPRRPAPGWMIQPRVAPVPALPCPCGVARRRVPASWPRSANWVRGPSAGRSTIAGCFRPTPARARRRRWL